MALRPTELQIILAATRDIERAQQIQQQYPRSQQETLALQFQQEIERRRRQTQATEKSEQSELKKVSSDEKSEAQGGRKRKSLRQARPKTQESHDQQDSSGDHIIDFLI